MSSEYQIRLYDRPLVSFSMGFSALGNVTGRICWVDESARALLPARLLQSCTFEDVCDWLRSRFIPRNRINARKVLSLLPRISGSALDIVDGSLGLSLNDAYWVTPEGLGGTWEECNLYQNEFDESVGLVAFAGLPSQLHEKVGRSPEWTTSGSYPKAWRNVGGRIVLYKAGNYPPFEGFANDDLGPFSEYFAAQVAERAGLAHVAYGLDVWRGHLASTCDLFCDQDVSYVPFHDATGRSGVPSCLVACEELGDEALEAYLDMLAFDAVILNDDRHGGNFGFMRDNHTGRFLGFAPLFDQNRSLLPTDMDADLASWPERAHRVSPAGSAATFDALMPALMTARQQDWLRRLLDFSPTQDETHKVSSARLEAIGAIVRKRASKLLRLPCHSLSEVEGTIGEECATRGDNQREMPIVTQSRLCDTEGQNDESNR